MLALAAASGLAPSAHGQAWYRQAFMGPANVGTFEKDTPKGTVRLGPVVVDLSAEAALEGTDNALLTPVGQSGIQASVGLTFDANWNAAKDQRLKLTGEVVEIATLSGPVRSQKYLLLKPGSALRYTVYVKQVRIMPFINLAHEIDPIASPTASNTAVYDRSSYDGGLQVDFPLNRSVLQLIGSRGIQDVTTATGPRSRDDRSSLGARAVRSFSAAVDAGVDLVHVVQDYTDGPSGSSTTESASLFCSVTVSRSVKLRASAGYDWLVFSHPNLAGDVRRRSDPSASLEISHRVRRYLSYTVGLSRVLSDETLTSNFFRSEEVRVAPALVLNERSTLRLDAGWTRFAESVSTGEQGTRRSFGADLEYAAPGDYFLSLSFRDLNKGSSRPDMAYARRTLRLSVRRQF